MYFTRSIGPPPAQEAERDGNQRAKSSMDCKMTQLESIPPVHALRLVRFIGMQCGQQIQHAAVAKDRVRNRRLLRDVRAVRFRATWRQIKTFPCRDRQIERAEVARV